VPSGRVGGTVAALVPLRPSLWCCLRDHAHSRWEGDIGAGLIHRWLIDARSQPPIRWAQHDGTEINGLRSWAAGLLGACGQAGGDRGTGLRFPESDPSCLLEEQRFDARPVEDTGADDLAQAEGSPVQGAVARSNRSRSQVTDFSL
jgi:hypothetical protein